MILTKYFSLSICIACMGIAAFPIVHYIMNGESTDLLPLDLPFIDKTTMFGYLVLTLFQLTMLLMGGFGLVAADLLMGLFFLYFVPFCELFKLRVREINAELKMHPHSAKSHELSRYLRNVLETHKDLCRYIWDGVHMDFGCWRGG